ncbi:heterodimeric geranylgeranyl pyrophosphate synthase small subunit, chloroplastic-like [Hevea brasiliensis]|uniref:heterodimeric geranylgeranyl pyrophosphate synthase small subunit, chloroplastic-like n=1 Tax=Hevea brasiliensis TaxID=3981 RepID=UPI0025D193AD|nr:heterodimeric geranylgeranyl pyrophosphate synthase small subunit, chloroplastic-like [Hevea brasiliensis]
MAGALSSTIHGNLIARAVSSSNPKHPLFSHRPMVVAMSTDQSYWSSVNADLDTHLKQAIPIRQPLAVFEPMRHLILSAPQTSAPALCIAACELVGGHRNQAMAAASALRLVHASASTHENLPLTDRPRPTPRTRPTLYGPNIELLIADGIIPFGFELLARDDDPAENNSNRVLRAIIEISRAMGSQGVIEGQYNESQYEESEGEEIFHVGWLQNVCRKKEGTLHACAGACGAILGGGREGEIEKLRRYGLYVGMVQGILSKVDERKEWSVKEVNKLRDLALKELKDFNQAKVKTISILVETRFCNL